MTKQSGFTLIEALVALLILSLGMLGIAAMQLNALHSATRSYQHSVATLAAVDAQERLWEALNGASSCKPGELSPSLKDDSGIESKWKNRWESDMPSNPLRNAKQLEIEGDDDCTYTIKIPLGSAEDDEDDGTVTYQVRLPKK